MKSRKAIKLIITFLTLIYWLTNSSIAYAQQENTPTFPNCINPQGTTIASYSTGTHGIVGSSSTYTGSDAVYALSEETNVQCFCPAEGSTGIQTNWWEIPEMSFEEIENYQALGWIYVPNGALWGLNENPYLTYNTEYSCKPIGGGGTSEKKKNKDKDKNDDDEDDDNGDVQGSATGIGGQIMGLASTGYNKELVISFATWISSLGLLLLMISKDKKNNVSNKTE